MLVRILLCLALAQSLLCNAWFFKKKLAKRTKCYREMYKDFQCYNLQDPYKNSLLHLPKSPSEQKIHFKLYTPQNRNSPQLLRALDLSSVRRSSFDANGKVAFVIHGFTGSSRKPWVLNMVGKLLSVVPNVIAVDWKEGAKPPNYLQAVANTRVVGAQIATLIKTLGVDPAKVHLIGHSLGAHVAGYAGEKFGSSSFSRTKIGRITGLDPASPKFEKYDRRVKLDPSDAAFVDVIHTEAPPVGPRLGMKERAGHVDVYPNGGWSMPECKRNLKILINPKELKPYVILSPLVFPNLQIMTCSHNRAPEYFIASIHDNEFKAYRCKNRLFWRACRSCGSYGCNRMGYHATPQRPGLFVLGTGSTYPF